MIQGRRSVERCVIVVSQSAAGRVVVAGYVLELGTFGRSRKWDAVADIRHARDELYRPFESQTEAAVRDRAILPEFEIPPIVFGDETALLRSPFFDLQSCSLLQTLAQPHQDL